VANSGVHDAEVQDRPMTINCQTCVALLQDYVQRELGSVPDPRDPRSHPEGADRSDLDAVALHIATCSACEALYYREFRLQGEQLGPEARRGALWTPVAAVVAHVAPAPDWSERILAFGRTWVDRLTGEVRAIEVRLADLLQVPPPALDRALAGLQGGVDSFAWPDLPQGSVQGEDFDLAVHVMPYSQPKAGAAIGTGLCRVEVAVTRHTAFGDYAGAEVMLLAPHGARSAVTDALGTVVFESIPRQDVEAIQFSIRMPGA
jgi:hypothetical protein